MQVFLETFADTCNVAAACRQARITRTTAYTWRREDQEFAAAWLEAEADGIDALNAAAFRRGVHGWDVPVVSMGRIVMTVNKDGDEAPLMERKYSDSLLLAQLKAHNPAYRDRREVELTGANGGPVAVTNQVVFVLPTIEDGTPELPFIDAELALPAPADDEE